MSWCSTAELKYRMEVGRRPSRGRGRQRRPSATNPVASKRKDQAGISRPRSNGEQGGSPRARVRACGRAYLYVEHLAEVTPWTPAAIRTMVARGILKEGIHFFRPHGLGSRPIFSWRAVVDYIEGTERRPEHGDAIRLADGTVIDLDEATKQATRLLR